MCWQTAVTVPVVANVLPTNVLVALATSESATFSTEASMGAPSRSAPSFGASDGEGAGAGAAVAIGGALFAPVSQAASAVRAMEPRTPRAIIEERMSDS